MEIELIIQDALEAIGLDVERNFYIADRHGFNEIADEKKRFPVVILDAQTLESVEPVNMANHMHSEYPSIGILFLDRTHFDDFKKEIVKGAIKDMRNLARKLILALVKNSNLRGTDSLLSDPRIVPVYNLFDVELSGVVLTIPLKQFDNFEYCL